MEDFKNMNKHFAAVMGLAILLFSPCSGYGQTATVNATMHSAMNATQEQTSNAEHNPALNSTMLKNEELSNNSTIAQSSPKILAYIPEFQAGPEYNFKKATWGMSLDEVKAIEDRPVGLYFKTKGTDRCHISYKEDLFGFGFTLTYSFSDNKLYEAEYRNDVSSKPEAYAILYDKLVKAYGQPHGTHKKEFILTHNWSFDDTEILFEYGTEHNVNNRYVLYFFSKSFAPQYNK